MHPNPVFHDASNRQNLDWARDRAFGVLAICGNDAPMLSHVPFLLNGDGNVADLHLVRSNPIARALANGPARARLAVSGPDGYVSPDWYGIDAQVPTWNYVAVHLTGSLELAPPEGLRDLLVRQSAFFERRLTKSPWTLDKMPPEALDRMMRMITPVRLVVEDVDGTWKLGQNKDTAARLAAADQIEGGMGAGLTELAGLMRGA
ncbi:MAG: FMN-binding negative transcriptional regulator [Marinibacterium sp.]